MRVKRGILAAIPDFFVVCLLLRNFVVGWSNRGRLRGRQAGSVAIAGTACTRDIIALMFGFRDCPGFGSGECRIVAGFKTISALGQIMAVFRKGHGPRIRRRQPGMVAIAPAVTAVREVALLLLRSHLLYFGDGQLGAITGGHAIPAIGHIALVLGDGYLL